MSTGWFIADPTGAAPCVDVITVRYPVFHRLSLLRGTEEQLAHGSRERWLVDGDVGTRPQ